MRELFGNPGASHTRSTAPGLTFHGQVADTSDMKMFPRIRRSSAPGEPTIFSAATHGLTVVPPDPRYLVWMEELREFLRGPGIDLSDMSYLESLYLDYCSDWHRQPTIGRWSPRTAINALGVAIGDCVCRQIPGARWQLVEAQGGTHLVIAAADGLVVAAPLTEMADQWLARNLNWVSAFPGMVLGRLPQPRDPMLRSQRRVRSNATAQSQL